MYEKYSGLAKLSQRHNDEIPGFSSATLWHQDIRFWLFDRADLVSMWLDLGMGYADNGGMKLIPGSHLQEFDRGRFDAAFF